MSKNTSSIDVEEVRRLANLGYTVTEIAKAMGRSNSGVHNCTTRNSIKVTCAIVTDLKPKPTRVVFAKLCVTKTVAEVAEEYGRQPNTVSKWASEFGMTFYKRKPPQTNVTGRRKNGPRATLSASPAAIARFEKAYSARLSSL